jgi:hypothetical protein
MRKIIGTFILVLSMAPIHAQLPFLYNFNNTGQRVCLLEAVAVEQPASVTIRFLDQPYNPTGIYTVFRRSITGTTWQTVASNLPANSVSWVDNNVAIGQAYEYKVKRIYGTGNQFATSHITAGIRYDQSLPKGSSILLIDSSIASALATEISTLKDDLAGEGYSVIEVLAPRATSWATDAKVIITKQRIVAAWNNAPANAKPNHLFILGHLPIARSGAGAYPPDEHEENTGARGADCYYADIDGVYTDTITYNPTFYIDPKAINFPDDLKWDQDYMPSSLEMAFGRIDFANLASIATSEVELYRNYLNRLHNYRMVTNGFNMGSKTAFRLGYDNSNDGSYRSLVPISKADSVIYCNASGNYNQWVNTNGPFQVFMQNSNVPSLSEWASTPMNATVFSSDQSYYGFWDEAESSANLYGKIRALMAVNSKCLLNIYTTTAINLFHQPGIGQTMGFSCQRIMNHSFSNQLYEKPFQAFDSTDFWNRTHFQLHGDPHLRLNQVPVVSNMQFAAVGSNLQISWQPVAGNNIIGYHVYKSNMRWGHYERITNSPLAGTSFVDNSGNYNNWWYMVKAIQLQTTGSGTYLNPSTGVPRQQNVVTSLNQLRNNQQLKVYPTVANTHVIVQQAGNPQKLSYTIINALGQLLQSGVIQSGQAGIDVAGLSTGAYSILFYGAGKKLVAIHALVKQ